PWFESRSLLLQDFPSHQKSGCPFLCRNFQRHGWFPQFRDDKTIPDFPPDMANVSHLGCRRVVEFQETPRLETLRPKRRNQSSDCGQNRENLGRSTIQPKAPLSALFLRWRRLFE